METVELSGIGDDRLDSPSVIPEPAPADDRLVKLAAVGATLGAIAGLFTLVWLRRHITIGWR